MRSDIHRFVVKHEKRSKNIPFSVKIHSVTCMDEFVVFEPNWSVFNCSEDWFVSIFLLYFERSLILGVNHVVQ